MELVRLQFVELVLKPCTRTYGDSPCAAALGVTGDFKCYNSPATCQDPENFLAGEQVIRFAVPTADLPVDYDYIPNVKNISVVAQKISPGESLGSRESVTSSHFNHPHNDVCYDKYVDERGFNPFNIGTHWGKFAARWPNVQGCEYRHVLGYAGQSINDMERRYYIVESTSGPDNAGGYSFTAKDAIKFLDGDKAVVPLPSVGVLAADITDSATSLTLAPAGVGDLYYPASGVASIGDEKVTFTRSGDAITLTGRELSGSKRDEHKENETFQLAEVFTSVEPSQAIYKLLNDFTDTPAEYLDLAGWSAETMAHIGRLFSREIMKPTAVKKIIDELIQQVGLVFYTDTINKKIVVRALRNLVPALTLDENSMLDQVTAKFDSDKRISQILMYYAQKNPLEKNDEEKNYAAILNSFVGDAVAALEGAPAAIKKIYATWITIFNRPAGEAVSTYILRRYGRAPRSVAFKTPVTVPIRLGSVFTLSSSKFEDSQGQLLAPLLFQAISVQPSETDCTVMGEQVPVFIDDVPDGVATVNIDEDSFNLNLRTVYDSIYLPPVAGDEVRFIIAAGVKIGSIGVGAFAIELGDWPDDVILKIYANNARFQGKGGDGGFGNGTDGQDGGTAIYANYPVTIYGNVQIWGGGGGGGGTFYMGTTSTAGGGGAGYIPGNPGATTEVGWGGFTATLWGGDPGEPGQSNTYPSGSAGGDAGYSILGSSFITFIDTPDIRGPQIS